MALVLESWWWTQKNLYPSKERNLSLWNLISLSRDWRILATLLPLLSMSIKAWQLSLHSYHRYPLSVEGWIVFIPSLRQAMKIILTLIQMNLLLVCLPLYSMFPLQVCVKFLSVPGLSPTLLSPRIILNQPPLLILKQFHKGWSLIRISNNL